ncbi:unnamed protein product [[Candida] boidinii]|uniref:Unnamed protein product n=1 Tax=Candida boidinii TaxID=5477 RepID=A0A9W6SYA3_CANBO|nr:hypothetical protein B5S30_g1044 [[Candida] boidinii]OWB82383.1 hypothetical protein B5S33_g1008 [[Candida] boidinii]GME69728.1 unnamed protein product [[Candida] boidinii]
MKKIISSFKKRQSEQDANNDATESGSIRSQASSHSSTRARRHSISSSLSDSFRGQDPVTGSSQLDTVEQQNLQPQPTVERYDDNYSTTFKSFQYSYNSNTNSLFSGAKTMSTGKSSVPSSMGGKRSSQAQEFSSGFLSQQQQQQQAQTQSEPIFTSIGRPLRVLDEEEFEDEEAYALPVRAGSSISSTKRKVSSSDDKYSLLGHGLHEQQFSRSPSLNISYRQKSSVGSIPSDKDLNFLIEMIEKQLKFLSATISNISLQISQSVLNLTKASIMISDSINSTINNISNNPNFSTWNSFIPYGVFNTVSSDGLRILIKNILHLIDNLLLGEVYDNSKSLVLKKLHDLCVLIKIMNPVNHSDQGITNYVTLLSPQLFPIGSTFKPFHNQEKIKSIMTLLLNKFNDDTNEVAENLDSNANDEQTNFEATNSSTSSSFMKTTTSIKNQNKDSKKGKLLSDQEGSFIAPVLRGFQNENLSVITFMFGFADLTKEHLDIVKAFSGSVEDLHFMCQRNFIKLANTDLDNDSKDNKDVTASDTSAREETASTPASIPAVSSSQNAHQTNSDTFIHRQNSQNKTEPTSQQPQQTSNTSYDTKRVHNFKAPFRTLQDSNIIPISMSIACDNSLSLSGTLGGYLYPKIPENCKNSKLLKYANSVFGTTCGHVVLNEKTIDQNEYPHVSIPSQVLINLYKRALLGERGKYRQSSEEFNAYDNVIRQIDTVYPVANVPIVINQNGSMQKKLVRRNLPSERFGQIIWGERIINKDTGNLSDIAIIKISAQSNKKYLNYLGEDVNFNEYDPSLMFSNLHIKETVDLERMDNRKRSNMNGCIGCAGLEVFKYGSTTKYTRGNINGIKMIYWSDGSLKSSEFIIKASSSYMDAANANASKKNNQDSKSKLRDSRGKNDGSNARGSTDSGRKTTSNSNGGSNSSNPNTELGFASGGDSGSWILTKISDLDKFENPPPGYEEKKFAEGAFDINEKMNSLNLNDETLYDDMPPSSSSTEVGVTPNPHTTANIGIGTNTAYTATQSSGFLGSILEQFQEMYGFKAAQQQHEQNKEPKTGLGVIGMLHSYDGEFKQFGLFTPMTTVLDRLSTVTGVEWGVVGCEGKEKSDPSDSSFKNVYYDEQLYDDIESDIYS